MLEETFEIAFFGCWTRVHTHYAGMPLIQRILALLFMFWILWGRHFFFQIKLQLNNLIHFLCSKQESTANFKQLIHAC